MKRARVGVLISGNGSNLQALIDAARDPDYPAEIALVVSNRAEAYGLARAEAAGIPAALISHRGHESREAFDRTVDTALSGAGVEIVCLAGFMRLLSPWMVERWQGRMLNIHPSLLPDFKGAHAVRDAFSAGVTETGCTVHVVTEELDAGPLLAQARVPVLPGDTEESLHQRIHAAEHALYPQALKEFALRLRGQAQ